MIDFLCIGAQKSGTTLLYEHLKQSSDIFLPNKKELHFFDNDKNYMKGVRWYEHFFLEAKREQLRGEVTPAYLFFKDVPVRIRHTICSYNKIKFIVLLRNPVHRAYSQYNMSLLMKKKEGLSFEQALFYERYRLDDYAGKINYSYLSRGFYSGQIINYFKYFNRDQFKFILYEDFVNNQCRVVNDILSFLGVREINTLSDKAVFRNEYGPMDPGTENILFEIYSKEFSVLEGMLGIDLSVWREGRA